jgi:hypothetical protein
MRTIRSVCFACEYLKGLVCEICSFVLFWMGTKKTYAFIYGDERVQLDSWHRLLWTFRVKIGKILHPALLEKNHITEIAFYVGNKFIEKYHA